VFIFRLRRRAGREYSEGPSRFASSPVGQTARTLTMGGLQGGAAAAVVVDVPSPGLHGFHSLSSVRLVSGCRPQTNL